jgi:glyoxylase-like metal-dependent hydrolase (beta-lactamase superfamily II)
MVCCRRCRAAWSPPPHLGYHILTDLGSPAAVAAATAAAADLVFPYQARLPDTKAVISAASGAAADIKLQDGDVISFGGLQLTAMATPGHTNGCMSFYTTAGGGSGMVFTGDALLIRGCGRTDFQEGGWRLVCCSRQDIRYHALGECCWGCADYPCWAMVPDCRLGRG